MDFTASTQSGLTKTITVPDDGTQTREQLAPVAARAFASYLDEQNAGGTPAPAAATPASAAQTIEIDTGNGNSARVQIAGFTQMTQAQQQEAVANVAAHLSGTGNAPASATPPAATAAPAPDNSYANDLGSGVNSLETGVRATSRLVGNELPDWVPGKETLQNFGAAAPITAPPTGNYQDAVGRLASDLRGGNYSQALSDLPHAAVQAAPSTLGAIGAGLAGGAVGNAPGAAAGIAAFTGATQAGDNVAARAAANGRTLDTASGGDIAGGLATTGVQAGLNVVGLKPGMVPGIGSALAKAGPVIRGAADVGADALAGGVGSVAQQAGTTAGTQQGLTVDPYAAEAAAATAAAARAGTIGGRAVKAGAGGAINAVDAAGYSRPSDADTAQRDLAVHRAILARKASDSANGRDTSYTDAAASLRTEQQSNMQQVGATLASQMSDADAAGFRGDYATLLNEAAAPGKSIGPSADAGPTTAFDRVQSWPIPDETKQSIQDGMLSLDALSQASRPSSAPGPAQKVLGLLGKGVGIAGGAYLGGVQGALDGVLGSPLAGHIGSAVGKGVDGIFGLSSAPPAIKARLAAGYLNRQGVDPSGVNPLQSSSDLLDTVRDPQNSIAAALPPDIGAPQLVPATDNSPATMMTPGQQARGTDLNETAGAWMERQIIAKAKAQLAAQQAAAASMQSDQASSALNGLKDQQSFDAANAKTAALVEAQKAMAQKANDLKNAQSDAAWSSRDPTYAQQQAMQAKGNSLNEAAANSLSGRMYRSDPGVQDARAAGVVGAAALNSRDPNALFQNSGGMAGSPVQGSDPLTVKSDGTPAQPQGVPTPTAPAVAPTPQAIPPARGVGLAAAAKAAQARAQAANAGPATPALGEAQRASSAQGPTSAGVLGGGLQTYIMRAAQSRGANPTGHDVNAAVDDLVQTDRLDPRVGDLIKAGANVPVGSPEAQAVLAQTFHRIGLGGHLMDGSQMVDPNAPMSEQARPEGVPPARAPIQDIVRWQAARDDAKQHVVDVARTAAAAGLPGAVAVIQAIGAVKSAAEKEKLRAEYLKTLSGKAAAMAKALLSSPALMRGV